MFDNIKSIPEWGLTSLLDDDGNVIASFVFEDGHCVEISVN